MFILPPQFRPGFTSDKERRVIHQFGGGPEQLQLPDTSEPTPVEKNAEQPEELDTIDDAVEAGQDRMNKADEQVQQEHDARAITDEYLRDLQMRAETARPAGKGMVQFENGDVMTVADYKAGAEDRANAQQELQELFREGVIGQEALPKSNVQLPTNQPRNAPQQQPAVSSDQVKADAEAELTKDGKQWADLTDIEKKQRIASVKKQYGVEVDEATGAVDVPDMSKQEGVKEMKKNRFEGQAQQNELDAQEKLDKKDWNKLTEEEKRKLVATVQIEHGVSVDENGKAVKADSRFGEFMNRLGGHLSNLMAFFEKLGNAFGKAFGKKNPNAPANKPANNPDAGKLKNKGEFDAERTVLENASNDAKNDRDTYRLALEEEKRILELPEYQQYKSPESDKRLAEVKNELNQLNKPRDPRSVIEDLLKNTPKGDWGADATGKIFYKEVGNGSIIKKENGTISLLQKDGTWKEARKAANIQEGADAQKYVQMLDAVGKNGERWVQIPAGLQGFEYGYLSDDPTIMLARSRDPQGKVTINKFDPLMNINAGGTWVKF